MAYATLDELRESLALPVGADLSQRRGTPAYAAKMLHAVPSAPVADRVAAVLAAVRGQRVLEFGASGALHAQVMAAAASYAGVDRAASHGVVACDLDDVTIPDLPSGGAPPTVILCGEVLEHLANPGYFLQRLRAQYPGVPVVVTVPNAFSAGGRAWLLERHTENVSIDHVAWYSYRTLRTLLERYGYAIETWHWVGGQPYTAEGLLVVAR
jgi:hypothetical protein